MNYALSSLAEIVGYSLCFLNDKYGRKRMLLVFLSLSSLVCLIVAFIPVGSNTAWIILVCALIGKASASAAFNACYVYTSYFFPTRIQNTMLLFVCSMGRLGSIVSPQINLLGQLVWSQLPYLVFGIGSLFGNVFIILLPSTESIIH